MQCSNININQQIDSEHLKLNCYYNCSSSEILLPRSRLRSVRGSLCFLSLRISRISRAVRLSSTTSSTPAPAPHLTGGEEQVDSIVTGVTSSHLAGGGFSCVLLSPSSNSTSPASIPNALTATWCLSAMSGMLLLQSVAGRLGSPSTRMWGSPPRTGIPAARWYWRPFRYHNN